MKLATFRHEGKTSVGLVLDGIGNDVSATLEVGDLIAIGTPAGVGILMQPPRFVKAGDVVRCEIEGPSCIEIIVRPESPDRSLS